MRETDRDHDWSAFGRSGGRPRLRPGERSVDATVRLPASECDALRREAAARGLSLSALIRERLAVASRLPDAERLAGIRARARSVEWGDDILGERFAGDVLELLDAIEGL